MKILYTAMARSVGGRDGRVTSSDDVLDLPLAVPESMGGSGGAATNPEQLFAAGYAACFHSALKLVARQQKKNADDSIVEAMVGIGRRDDGGFGLDVELHVAVPGVEQSAGEALAAAAHRVCPYSNATRGNIDVRLVVETQALQAT